jgi:hypothetical protein
MLPIASHLATCAVRSLSESALPGAPAVPDPAPAEPRIRAGIAAFLRRSAQRRSRLADRLDPACPAGRTYAAS